VIEALRASTMKEALQSAKQLRHRMDTPRKDTGALRVGRGVHLAVLQPDVYDDETGDVPAKYVTKSGMLSTGNACKAWFVERKSDGITYLTPDERNDVRGMAQAVFNHAAADKMLQSAQGREVTAIWFETTPNGQKVACKARADALGGGMLLDLKSTREIKKFTAGGVASVVATFGYEYQFGWYERGLISAAIQSEQPSADLESMSWTWIFVQSAAPHDVIVATADEEMEDFGRWRAQSVWEIYASAVDSGVWPGVEAEPVVISLPRWAVPKEDDGFDGLGLTGLGEMQ
jgi:hypothetical protein